jgi:hypothetical protein
MHFTFTLTDQDIQALRAVTNRRITNLANAKSKLFFSNLITWIPIGVAFAGYGTLYRQHPELARDLSVIAMALLIGVAFLVANNRYKRHIFNKALLPINTWIFSEQTIDISPDGIKTEGAYGSSNLKWAAFVHTDEDQINFYLFIDNRHAVLIPKSVFTSPDQLAQIKAWVRA